MNLSEFLRRASCPACDWTSVWGPEEMAQQLRLRGKLRRDAQPDPRLVCQLFEPLKAELPCPSCGRRAIEWRDLDDGEDDWGVARTCEICRILIPPERIEVFPEVRRCAKCQSLPQRDLEEADFCPRCGGLLTMKTAGRGVTRYIRVCASCHYRD